MTQLTASTSITDSTAVHGGLSTGVGRPLGPQLVLDGPTTWCWVGWYPTRRTASACRRTTCSASASSATQPSRRHLVRRFRTLLGGPSDDPTSVVLSFWLLYIHTSLGQYVFEISRKPIVRIWPNFQGFGGDPIRLRIPQNLGIWRGNFEGGGGKEKSLTPIFSPLGGPGAPKFSWHWGLPSPPLPA